ncbi:MAG: cysteine hydrolase [Ardenticatenia bacterium]|nr:MAG: cysteine hydrolase [Ardenticatenia bacterium]
MSIQFVPGETVAVPEIAFKERVELPADKTALIIVDMQNDFVKEGGTLVVPAAIETVPNIQRLLERARSAGVKVVFTQDTHFDSDPEWQIWPEHCRANTWGWEIIEELKPQEGELICQKNRYDGFYGTWLDHFLRVWGIENVVIVGTVSSICVLHTAASAGLRWYNIVVPADGVSALNDFDQALTLRQVSWLYTGSVTKSVDDIAFT